MKIADFVDVLMCNEPTFDYNGTEYNICYIKNQFYIGISGDESTDKVFDTVDEMLNDYYIDGKPLKQIVDKINI